MEVMTRLLLFPVLAAGLVDVPTKEIAPGVRMPWVSIGTGTADKTGGDLNASLIVGNWLTNGGRGIDTAWSYFNQEDVSNAIASSGVDRKDIFIMSKILMCMPQAAVRWMVKQNLQKLHTTYFDLMLIHMPSNMGPLDWCASTWELLEEYYAQGTFRSIGLSNFRRRDIELLMKTAKVTPHLNSVQFNVFHHNDDTAAACREHNISTHAFSPFTDFKMPKPSENHTVFHDPTVLKVANNHNVTAAQVAARWLYQHDHVFSFLSSSPAHQENSANFLGFNLPEEDMALLDKIQASTYEAEVFV